jgi:hypothetical protein
MPGRDTSLNVSADSDHPFGTSPDSPSSPAAKREVTPLFLSPKEKQKADDHTPPGLNNPFWSS